MGKSYCRLSLKTVMIIRLVMLKFAWPQRIRSRRRAFHYYHTLIGQATNARWNGMVKYACTGTYTIFSITKNDFFDLVLYLARMLSRWPSEISHFPFSFLLRSGLLDQFWPLWGFPVSPISNLLHTWRNDKHVHERMSRQMLQHADRCVEYLCVFAKNAYSFFSMGFHRLWRLIANATFSAVQGVALFLYGIAQVCRYPHLRACLFALYERGQQKLLRQDPLEAILVIFGRRALIFFVWKLLEKNEKWHHFCAHALWWSPWRRKNVEKGHLAPSNLTFLLIAIDTNGFCRMKEEGQIYKNLTQIF